MPRHGKHKRIKKQRGGQVITTTIPPSLPAPTVIYTLPGSVGKPGLTLGVPDVQGVAVDSFGNVYASDAKNHRIRKITPDGVVTNFVGFGGWVGAGIAGFADGSGNTARFNAPQGIALDSAGFMYVADMANHRIRKITPDGSVVSTLAGSGTVGFLDDTGPAARFSNPYGVAVDSAGFVYVAEFNTHRIRKITPSGVVTTLAGSGAASLANGVGAAAAFNNPRGVAVDSSGTVYVADTLNHTIRQIKNGIVSTLVGWDIVAGSYVSVGNFMDGLTRFNSPAGIAVDSAGNVYVSETVTGRIRKITPERVVTTVAGTGGTSFLDGPALQAAIRPNQLAIDSSGKIYFSDYPNITTRIAVLSTSIPPPVGLVVSTLGSGFSFVYGVAVDASGNVYVCETMTGMLKKIRPDGGILSLTQNNRAPVSVTVDSLGNIYYTSRNNTIEMIDKNGVETTLAGTGTPGFLDGPGNIAKFSGLSGIAIDSAGFIYVADTGNIRIRKIDKNGVVSTFAGTGGWGRADGDAGVATFSQPRGLAFDSENILYVADRSNNRIRKITPDGKVSTLSFNTQTYFQAYFYYPVGVAIDSARNIYVCDENHRITKTTQNGMMTILAGGLEIPGFRDGLAEASQFNLPAGIAVDTSGKVYVADSSNRKIRVIGPPPTTTTLGDASRDAWVDWKRKEPWPVQGGGPAQGGLAQGLLRTFSKGGIRRRTKRRVTRRKR